MRLTNGAYLVFETRGLDAARDRTKRKFLAECVSVVSE